MPWSDYVSEEDTPDTIMWEISHAQPGVRHHKCSLAARSQRDQQGEISRTERSRCSV